MSGEPRTAAGRALADLASALWWQPNRLAGANAMQSATRDVRAAIARIEDEAAGERLDVERLAKAVAEQPFLGYPVTAAVAHDYAVNIARRYRHPQRGAADEAS